MIRAALLLLLTTSLNAMGSFEEQHWTGVVSMKGNMPFSALMLSVDQKSWKLEGPAARELERTAQGQRVRVTGTLRDGIITVTAWEPLAEDTAP